MTIKKLQNISVAGFKLVIASVSTGNVAQLAADLFVESLSLKKFALIWNTAVIPIIGPSAFGSDNGDLTTACEIFIDEKNKLLIFQTRSPVTAALLDGFIAEILSFIQDEKISQLIILSSAFSHEQHSIENGPFEFIANESLKEKNFPGFNEAPQDFQIHGCGYAKKLHQQASYEKIPSAILYKFVSEGDNYIDGLQLCQKVNSFLQVIPTKDGNPEVKIPVSWKNLFGRNVNHEIY